MYLNEHKVAAGGASRGKRGKGKTSRAGTKE
jgi:hypothetical protein